jgi:hypothetical protein
MALRKKSSGSRAERLTVAVTPWSVASAGKQAKTCYLAGVIRRGLLLVVAALVGPACGRRATPADCQLILDRAVELQMKELKDASPEAIAQRQEVMKKELADDVQQKCDGKSVSDAMMNCVRGAKTTEDLQTCLR